MATWYGDELRPYQPGTIVRETNGTIDFTHDLGAVSVIDSVTITFRDAMGSDPIYLTLNDTDDAAQFVINATGTDSYIYLLPADTVNMVPKTYTYDIRIITVSGDQHVVEGGTLEVLPTNTGSSDPSGALLASYASLSADNTTNAADLAALQLSCCTVLPGLELQLIALGQTLTATAAASATVLTISSSGDFTAGDPVTILLDTTVTFGTTIASVDDAVTITIDDALPTQATSGNYIRFGADFTACLAGC